MDIALEYAKKYYSKCYLETLSNMVAAQKFYEKYGFIKVDEPILMKKVHSLQLKETKDLNQL